VACCRWPCFGRRVGLDDPQRSLPTPNILWFCDSLHSSFALVLQRKRVTLPVLWEADVPPYRPPLDAASIAHLPAARFARSFGSFLGGCVLMNCCNDFVTKSGQHRLLALVDAFTWSMWLVCGVRLNDSWLLYWGWGFIS